MNQINSDQDSGGKKGHLPSTTNQSFYSSIASLWGGAVRAQHALLAGYITAHSFLIAAVILLFLSFDQDHSNVVGIGVLVVSAVGLLLSLQMALAWGRFVARVALLEWHLQRIEKQYNRDETTVFTDWAKIRDNPTENLVDPRDSKNQFNANWAVRHHRKWWAARAKMIPILTGIVYLFFFSVSAVNLGMNTFKSTTATISRSETEKPIKQTPKKESFHQEGSGSYAGEKPKAK